LNEKVRDVVGDIAAAKTAFDFGIHQLLTPVTNSPTKKNSLFVREMLNITGNLIPAKPFVYASFH
jgi:hypothetical protein